MARLWEDLSSEWETVLLWGWRGQITKADAGRIPKGVVSMQWPEGMVTKIQAVAGHWNSIQVSCLEHVT